MSPSDLETLLKEVTPEQGRKLEEMLKVSSDKEIEQLDIDTIRWALKMRKPLKFEVVTLSKPISKPRLIPVSEAVDPDELLDDTSWGLP